MGKHRSAFIGAAAVSIAAILWGLDGIVLTPRLYDLNIGYVVFILHLIPFGIMNLFMFRQYRELSRFTPGDGVYFLLVALTGGVIGTMAIVKALFLVNFQDLTIIVLLQKLQPVFAISLSALLLKEAIRRNFLQWALLAILAGYFLTFGWRLPDFSTGSATVSAALFSLLAAASFGSSTVLSKKILLKFDFRTATFFRYGITALIMLIYVAASGQFSQFSITTPMNWVIFLIIAFTTGSGAIFLYYFGLTRVKAIVASICELFFPFSAILFDYIFNGNTLSPVQWISAAVMVFAIFNLNRTSA
ncbi:MAG: DMT family transporter [Bacteroidales bacterium]|nr:DMT family transporter [Lentimicrobiaceae bacterium]MDD5694480.1 DMT family transporter [Bacteroidales bacterium]